MLDWPTSLPQKLEVSSFQNGFGQGAIRTEMDSGPAFQRQRFTATTPTVQGMVMIDAAQYQTFVTFYADLAQGALPFNWAHPITNDPVSMRFDVTSPPQVSPRSPRWFQLSMSLEILP